METDDPRPPHPKLGGRDPPAPAELVPIVEQGLFFYEVSKWWR